MSADSASAIVVAAVEGESLSDDERYFLRHEKPAGVTLFRRNISDDLSAVLALTRDIQATRQSDASPLIVAVDQEGGRVSRIRAPFPNEGPAANLANGSDEALALAFLKSYGLIVGAGLKGLGFNVNFAPVLDIQGDQTDQSIGDRAFGTSPLSVSRRAGAFQAGLSITGVAGCLKHFPGQGAATSDTHKALAIVDREPKDLLNWELMPFRDLIATAPMVMISHCTYARIDSRPASRSATIIEGLLRRDLNFGGVVVSDDMNMGAVASEDADWEEALVSGVSAGLDLLLICRHLHRAHAAIQALRRAADRDSAFRQRLAIAAARVAKLRLTLLPDEPRTDLSAGR